MTAAFVAPRVGKDAAGTLTREGAAGVAMRFRGRFVPESFAEFARHRAARLDLALLVLEVTPEEARARVAGPAALLDAFEVALSLGPLDCLVLDVRRDTA